VRRRLLLLTAFSSTLVLLVLAVTVLPLIRPRVTERLDQELREPILAVAAFVVDNSPTDEQLAAYLATLDTSPDHRLGVVSTFGRAPMGSDAARLGRYYGSLAGVGTVAKPKDWPAYLYPRFFVENGDRVASQGVSDGQHFWIIEGTIPRAVIARHERQQWLIIAGLAALALAISLVGAAVVSRRITRPITRAIATAEALGAGDLTAVAPDTGPKEVVELGVSLNRLAGRIDRLLVGERERATSLSHRLRTPLTVLRLEAERAEPLLAASPEQRDRLHAGIADLERGLDEIIRESQQTREDGVSTSTDARAVVLKHLEYWSPLAAAQEREVTRSSTAEPLPVTLSAEDLGVVLDAVFSNIFRHTAPGVGFRVDLRRDSDRMVLEVVNEGDTDSVRRPAQQGSTGVGLEIARKILRSAGGTLTAQADPSAGFAVVIRVKLAAGTLTGQTR